jgi:hypothetical protein
MILFGVLVACALAGIYCAIHFGSTRALEEALAILRERPNNPQPNYLAVLIPPAPDPAAGQSKSNGPHAPASTARSLASGR